MVHFPHGIFREAVGETAVPNSVLEAIQAGIWNFEPQDTETNEYEATKALPGSHEKLTIMADRLEQGLPLWHPKDRRTYEDAEKE